MSTGDGTSIFEQMGGTIINPQPAVTAAEELNKAERAAWAVAIKRGLNISAGDLRAMLTAARLATGSGVHQRLTRLCLACGVWTCAACGWERRNVNMALHQACGRCGGTDGTLRPTRHTRDRWIAHNSGKSWLEAPH